MSQDLLTDEDAYDLFRQAIVERSEGAWQTLYYHFYPVLLTWSRQACRHGSSDECPEDIANHAFARAWHALSPEQFHQFESAGGLLGYLRACVNSAVIDIGRSFVQRERLVQRSEIAEVATPEQQVVQNSLRAEVWQALQHADLSELDRVVLEASFVHALPPRAIVQAYPQLFESVRQVYAIKRNLLARLARYPQLQALYREFGA